MDGDRKMKREVQFVNSMTEKLKTQGDISKEEATRMFVLASVIYAYGMGEYKEGRFWDNFNYRFDFSELSDAIGKWYEELLTRIPDEISDKYPNCITSIPSVAVCPPPESIYYKESTAPRIMDAICEIRRKKTRALEERIETSDSVCANGPMVEWLKSNVPLSFDVTYCYKRICDFEVQFARFGVLNFLPIHVREIDEDGLGKLSNLDIPILRTENISRKGLFRKFYRVACPPEHRDILDAVADGLPVPERRPVEKRPHTPRDLLYIDTLTSRISCGRDISIEEADDLYLLFKMYQAIRTAALNVKGSIRQEMKDSAEPGLNALRSWYKAVEKELKKNRKGNFVYTLPNDTNMNLYQLRDPVERCLKMLPKEPTKVVVRYKDRFPVKDDCLDAKSLTTTGTSDRYVYYLSGRYGFFDRNGIPVKDDCLDASRYGFFDRNGIHVKDDCLDAKSLTTTGTSDRYVYYLSGRYGFFDRNDININEWCPVAEYKDGVSYNVFDDFRGKPIFGKLRFAESLGIRYIIINDMTIAVKKKDLDRVREILDLPDDEIMRTAYFLAKKGLKEIRSEMDRLKKKPENQEALDILIRKERRLRTLEDEIPLEYIIEGVKVVYQERKERKEYLEEDGWMEIER